MNYEVRKQSGTFNLYREGTLIGKSGVNIISHDIHGEIDQLGTFTINSKGFLFWHHWTYTENNKKSYKFKINSWRNLTLEDKANNIVFGEAEVILSNTKHLITYPNHDSVINKNNIKALFVGNKNVIKTLPNDAMCRFTLTEEKDLLLVFGYCALEWVRSHLSA